MEPQSAASPGAPLGAAGLAPPSVISVAISQAEASAPAYTITSP